MQAFSMLLAAVVALRPVAQVPTQVGTDTLRIPGLGPGLAQALSAAGQGLSAIGPALEGARQGLEALRSTWADQDPADSLYRAARQALNRGEYTAAANLFGDITKRYPQSTYAADAHYWAAFALYRTGEPNNLQLARSLLEFLRTHYPRAGTRGDAATLYARVQGELARRGDADAAAWLAAQAQPPQRRPGEGPITRPPPGQGPTGTPPGAQAPSCPSENDEDDVRIAALNGLLQMDAVNAVPILKKVLARRDACSAGLRRKAVFLVSQKRTSETEDILLDAARNDPDAEVREQAVFWLSQVPTDRAVTMLDSILRTSTDEELLEKAIFALSQHASARARQSLRAYAERADAPAQAREKAIFWLGQNSSSENGAFLRALYARLTDEELKEKVIFSLSQMRGAENGRWLMEIALNEREPIEMRKKALFWAGQTGAAIADLAALYDRIQNRDMKDQLIFVYSQRNEATALDKLIAIAKTETDRELRKKAIFWLGQSHDPRAAQVLLEIINQ